MKCQSFPCVAAVFALALAWGLTSLHGADEAALDTATIEAITELKGVSNQTEGTFKVSKPRDDVSVTVEQTHMAPFMGLTSWAAFMPSGKDSAMVMGDLVLFEDEVNPVMSAALNAGLQVTALHNHFFFDKPKVYFMHIGGEGSVSTLAQGVKVIFDTEKQIRTKAPAPLDSFGLGEMSAKNAIDGSGISQVFGQKGDANIVAIHQHMTGEDPRMIFLHYYGRGKALDLARGVKAAINTQPLASNN